MLASQEIIRDKGHVVLTGQEVGGGAVYSSWPGLILWPSDAHPAQLQPQRGMGSNSGLWVWAVVESP